MAELIKLIIKCMDEKEEFYLEEVKGLTRALLCHTRIILIQFCDKAFHINKQPCPGAQTVFL